MTELKPPNFRTSVMNIDRPGDPTVFGDDVRAATAEIIARYPAGQARSALLPMLHLVQSEQGYVTPDGIAFCAEVLDLTKAQVAAVVTFYTMFKRSPTGEFLVSVCRNALCGMLGGDEIYAALSEELGVGMNETTADGTITLEHAECLAACDYAPVVTVNYEFFDNQTVGSARTLVRSLRAGQRPMPSRGAPLCTFREIERLIAGFPDLRSEALEWAASGAPTEAGVRLALDRQESAPSYATRSETTTTPTGPRAEALGQPTSAHDAPLATAESDPGNPTPPAGQKEG
jgi:NADH-quinone oxidoreductase subunit E